MHSSREAHKRLSSAADAVLAASDAQFDYACERLRDAVELFIQIVATENASEAP